MKVKDSVWARAPGGGFDAATITAIDGNCVEILANRKRRTVKLHEVFEREENMQTKADCCGLTHLNEANIVANLQARYEANEIYTFTSAVLLALNPYKPMKHLYTQAVQKSYHKLPSLHSKPPHPYALADLAYRHLICDKKNQACVISGESGAGKTETAKILMSFLAERSRTAEAQSAGLQNKILEGANPILESLGNATTVRNGNSSRFGKYNMLGFNPVGNLVGAEVRTYLLENCRVVAFGKGERTYHVFYEFLYGHADPGKFHLEKNKNYALLTGPNAKPMLRSDAANFTALQTGFSAIDFDEVQQEAIYRVLAGIIHMGEVQFVPTKGDGCEIKDNQAMEFATEMLGLDLEKLTKILLFREMKVRNGRSNEVFYSPHAPAQAVRALESLMKMLYKRAFSHVVDHINAALSNENAMDNAKHIGILDIYGFEQLQRNSFEQLCINLANERLQDFFVENVLNFEQELYTKEGLPWEEIQTPDADPVINSLVGILRILDDHGMKAAMNQETSDAKFTADVHRQYVKPSDKDSVVTGPKRGRAVQNAIDASQGFVVKHYAGEVTYETSGCLDKNNARLLAAMECVIRDSTNELTAQLTDEDACDASRVTFTSVAKKYVIDLEDLMDTLGSCDLHYVRCYKPNLEQKPNKFNVGVCQEQLVQSGTVELVKLMHDGYPHRCMFADLKERFLPVLPKEFSNEDPRMFLEALMFIMDLDKKDWTLGTSRLFLKSGKLAVLDSIKTSADGVPPEMITKLKAFMRRKKLRRCLHAVQLSIWLPKFQKRIRMQRLFEGLRAACHTYIRLFRWLKRVRSRLRAEQITQTCMELRSTSYRYVRIMRWMDRSVSKIRARRKARAEELLQCLTRRAMLNVYVKRWMMRVASASMKKKHRRERAEALLHHVARRASLNVHMIRWVKKKVRVIRERRAKAQTSLNILRQRAFLYVHLRRWARARTCAIRERKQDHADALLMTVVRRALLLVHVRRWTKTTVNKIRQRKRQKAHKLLTILAQRALLNTKMRKFVRKTVSRIRKRKQDTCAFLLSEFARRALLNLRIRRYVQKTVSAIRERKKQNAWASLAIFSQRALFHVHVRRWVRHRANAIRERKRREERARVLLAFVSRRAMLLVQVRRWTKITVNAIRERKQQKAQSLLKILAQRALLSMKMKKFVRKTVSRIRKCKQDKCSFLLSEFARRALLHLRVRRYVKKTVSAIRERKKQKARASLTIFSQRALFHVHVRRWVCRRTSVIRERKSREERARVLLAFVSRRAMLLVHVRRWTKKTVDAMRGRKRQKTQSLLTILAQRALLNMTMKTFVRKTVCRIRAHKENKCSFLLSEFARRALLHLRMRRYVKKMVSAIRERKKQSVSSLLTVLARRALLYVCVRRHVRRRLFVMRDMTTRQLRADTRLTAFARHALFIAVLSKWMKRVVSGMRDDRRERARKLVDAAIFARRQRRERPCMFLAIFWRRALLIVYLRRWLRPTVLAYRENVAATRRKKAFGRISMLIVYMKRHIRLRVEAMRFFEREFLYAETDARIRQSKEKILRCDALLSCLWRRTLLVCSLRRFMRTWQKARAQHLRDQRRDELLITFTRRALLNVEMRRYVQRCTRQKLADKIERKRRLEENRRKRLQIVSENDMLAEIPRPNMFDRNFSSFPSAEESNILQRESVFWALEAESRSLESQDSSDCSTPPPVSRDRFTENTNSRNSTALVPTCSRNTYCPSASSTAPGTAICRTRRPTYGGSDAANMLLMSQAMKRAPSKRKILNVEPEKEPSDTASVCYTSPHQ
eukprot:GEMP01000926.1.p1 GENE.GEMP01000926.1~~GEMP01000926.1.p1  ORF type:complete len:1782 (+),score=395.26 GEMP01000926.1:290-5635(+)